jgi:hypothetical protein
VAARVIINRSPRINDYDPLTEKVYKVSQRLLKRKSTCDRVS